MAVTYKKIPTLLILPAMALSMSGCSFVSKGLKAIDGKNADRIEKILNEGDIVYMTNSASTFDRVSE